MSLLSPSGTAENAVTIGFVKSKMPLRKLIVLGILAGAFIAIGGMLSLMVGKGLAPVIVDGIKYDGLSKLVSGALFPVGLMLVIIAGGELFTGNVAYMAISVFAKKTTWLQLGRNWLIVYLTNFIGALFVAFCLAYLANVFSGEPYFSAVKKIAENKTSLDFMVVFWRGIGANWLVCLGVWLALSADDVAGKILGIWFPVMAFVVLGMEHSIANMFFVPLGMFYGAKVTIGQLLINNLLPATLGNIVGGAIFVAMAYWFTYLKEKKL